MIAAEVIFLAADQGGRSRPPTVGNQHRYMPHIVVESRDAHGSVTKSDGVNCELYQGVAFVAGPSKYEVGQAGQFLLELIYFPALSYSDVVPGARFTVREGGKIVGHGVVLSRTEVVPSAGVPPLGYRSQSAIVPVRSWRPILHVYIAAGLCVLALILDIRSGFDWVTRHLATVRAAIGLYGLVVGIICFARARRTSAQWWLALAIFVCAVAGVLSALLPRIIRN